MEASKKIMQFYSAGYKTEMKQDGSPVTQADLAASDIIGMHLSKTGIPITGEETLKADFSVRKHWEELWCVDPLDGTKEFVKKNGEFAVNIALIRNKQPVFGIIASPVKEKMLVGGKETGVFLIDFSELAQEKSWIPLEMPTEMNSPLVITCSHSSHSEGFLGFLSELTSEHSAIDFIKRGSSLKFFDLATGKADAYPRFAPTMEWDIAAGQAILEGLGGSVVHAKTKLPLHYNKENLMNPFFIARTAALLRSLP